MKKGKRPLPPSGVPDPKQPRLPRDEGKACVCYPYSLSHLSLTKTLSSLPTLSFMLSRLEAYKQRKANFTKSRQNHQPIDRRTCLHEHFTMDQILLYILQISNYLVNLLLSIQELRNSKKAYFTRKLCIKHSVKNHNVSLSTLKVLT